MALIFARLANAVELQGQRALLVRGVILVQNTLSSSLIDRLHCDLVSALGLGGVVDLDDDAVVTLNGVVLLGIPNDLGAGLGGNLVVLVAVCIR